VTAAERRVVELLDAPAATLDRDGVVRYASRALLRLTGQDELAVLGRSFLALVEPHDAGEAALLASAAPCGPPVEAVLGLVGGGCVRFRATAGDDGCVHVAGHELRRSADPGDRRHRYEREGDLRAAGRLAGSIAHDCGNLLGLVLSATDTVEQLLRSGAPVGGEVAEIRAAAERAALLTRRLLTVGRGDVTKVEPVPLADVVTALRPLLRRALPRTVELSIEVDDALPAVLGDVVGLEQVVLNLVLNARDAVGERGAVAIRARRAAPRRPGSEGFVLLQVGDDGHGMTSDELEHACDPAFTTRTSGHGLGLATVREIVSRTGGRLGIASEPGRGTVVSVHLPVAPPGVPRATPERSEDGAATVLVVEDEPGPRRETVRVLSAAGHAVFQAADPCAALAAIRRGLVRPALLIADLGMPGMTGTALAASAREALPALRVLYLTGATPRGELGDDPLLRKPFDAAALLGAVGALLLPEAVTASAGGRHHG